MRFLAVSTFALLASLGVLACDNQAVSPLPGTLSEGGSTSSNSTSGSSLANTTTTANGGSASGGITGSGTTASGGIPAQGGTRSNTSSVSTGGKSAGSGGTSANGSTSSATGGTSASSATGGTSAIGGTKATGGAPAMGGVPATGGTKATGGAPATGGTKATGGVPATGGTTAGVTVTKITNGQNGTTSRYWDCCMPSCSWSANASGKSPVKVCGKDGTSFTSESAKNACDNGGGYMCYWGAPWSVSSTVSYGYAAFNGVACGTCFQLDFTGSGINASGLSGKSMIVQAINIGSIAQGQFDLLIPGGGVGAMNACTSNGNQWNGAAVGDQYGGLLKTCNDDCNCAKQKCQSVFGSMPALLAGCNWFTDWFGCADNPGVVYKQVPCPSDITSKSGESG